MALYIHWPFCLSKCPYCDFNSHVRDVIPSDRFIAALRAELAREAARLGPRRLTSIFFGGGTPSLMPPDGVAELIGDAFRLFPPDLALNPASEVEITLEANPTSVEAGRLAAFRQAGVNRISLGIQSLDDDGLKLLGRTHSAAQAIAALELARGLFPRVSFDLICARPGQTPEAWRSELNRALDLVTDHLSLYQLTIEPGTKFEALYRQGKLVLPEEDIAVRLYELTGEVTSLHGLEGYEVSNYAVPGRESRHNLSYWRYEDYAGIGPGAHGRLTLDGQRIATRRHRAPEIWAERVEGGADTRAEETALTQEEQAREMLLMGLRLKDGVRADSFRQTTGLDLSGAVAPDALALFVSEGWIVYDEEGLRTTSHGRLILEALLSRLIL
ncbi:radical SAM family heme chaperone HemW [Acetobacter sp. AN02]|uniref:radical SAM family heme chaperone HemW n=1 Tax=Acetobacter sp. AN02 TaxID=2894186 RepID=UPI0024345782|nr:radical SAM family heme chaperone HemW [Acetobacter sp. AN02]MDG6095480.1 radical SAM family heme chaperone HemW [Acetobacter sp. AN02]